MTELAPIGSKERRLHPDTASERAPDSPCIGICLIDPAKGCCRGCLRTVAEIAGWYEASAFEKRAILVRIAARREPETGRAPENSA